MKKIILMGVILMTSIVSLTAQQVQDKNGIISNPEAMPSEFLGTTGRLVDLPIDTTLDLPIKKLPKFGLHNKDDWYQNPSINPNALPVNGDPIVQKDYNTTQSRSTQMGNWAGITTTTMPGDPTVDVGPNHVVQMLNGSSGARVQIWNKSGTTLAGPINFTTLSGGTFSGLGDPIVLYDHRADRWVLTEFCDGCNNLYIAISTTPDPTGTYNIFSVTASSFPDYPKYSIWDNSYLITANEGSTTSSVYILNRTAMLAGGSPNAQRFTVPRFGTIGFQATTPVSLLGTTPSGGPALLMRMRDDAWSGAATDALEIWELNINWSNPSAATLAQSQTLNVSPFESEFCGYTSFSCIPQQGSTTKLDPLRELLMNRIMYRNFGSYEALVCAHVTDVNTTVTSGGTDLAGIRWYELRRTGGPTSSWTIYQEGTYAPNDGLHRWMPTIGLSASGNIGLAYNVAGSAAHPEIRYTGRKECDPLGVMTETEIQLVDGTSPNNSNRWGDYNQMGVDPSDGETFWFTAQYNPATQARTRIGAFKIATCSATVSFNSSSYSVNEADANVASGCKDYYVLDVPISISVDPSQPADITINVTGGTATQNIDYSISNTSFTLDGTTLTGTAQITIYNDNNTEGDETITLGYTLNANGGDASAGVINQSVTITIVDDDLAPSMMPGVTSTIYSNDFESGFGTVTTVNSAGATAFQIGNEATAQSTAYNIPSDNTTQFAWVNDDACNCNQNSVYLSTPSLDLSNYLSANITFDSYFEDNTYNSVNENADLVVSLDGGSTYTTIAPIVASGIDVSWTNQSFDVSAYIGNSNVIFAILYSDAGGWLYGCSIDNIEITGELPIDIQTAVNTGSGMTGNLGPNETVHFYDPTSGDVMLSIVNTSSFDYGCVTVEVDRDGSTPTALEFASVSVPDYLHGKTFRVIPTNNNTSGTFDITLYYKEAEVAAWESITGNSRTNLEIIEVRGNNKISDVTPANYTSYSIDNITASLGSFYSDVTLTSSFSNGFGGFGAGIYNITTVTVTLTTSFTNPICNGSSDGTITLSASGGSGPYEYSIDGGTSWSSTSTFSGLSAGTYNVIARDAGLNQSTITVITLTNPTAITFTSSSTNASCGSSDGTITITASGGNGTLQYSIDGGSNYQASNSFTGLATGSYSIIVKDANNCQATGSQTVNSSTGPTISSITPTNLTCNGASNGSLVISATGGTGTLQYSVDGGTTFQTSNSFTGLTAGTYSVVVKDANNCQTSGTGTITQPAANTFNVTGNSPTCNGGTNGSIVFSGATGPTPRRYSINGGSTFQVSSTFSGLAAGTYNLAYRDGNMCIVYSTITITEPTAITFTSSVSNENCGNGDGSITITASGGTGTLQYSSNGGTNYQTSNIFSGLAAGNYSIVVKDANNCQTSATVTVGSNTGPTITSVNHTNVSCFGGNNGTITINASGTPTLEFSVDGGSTWQTSNVFTNLSASTYSIYIKDGIGCQLNVGNLTITQPSQITYTSTITASSCSGSTGGITLSSSGGTGTLQYSINGGSSFQTSSSFTGLAATSYNIVIKDNNNCQTTGTEVVGTTTGAIISSATPNDVSCNGGSDGSISITATGTATLQYSIDGGSTFSTSSAFSGLGTGSFTIVVKDGNNCVTTGSTLTIGEPTAISFTTSTSNASCGLNNGSITISASGGTGSLQYSINGGTTFQSSASFSGLAATNYNIIVKDANNCQTAGSATISNASAPVITNQSSSNITCNGLNNGTITLAATGTATLQYSINGGSSFVSSSSFTGLSGGTYQIVVRDGNGCTTNGSPITISEPSAITFSTTTVASTCGSNNGSITFTASGGTGALQYSVNGGSSFQTSSIFSGLNANTYNVVVKDGNGCQVTGTATVSSTASATISSVNKTNLTCNGSNDGSITINATGTAPLSYSINGGTSFVSSSSFTGLSAGTYQIVVRDGNGCTTNGTNQNVTQPAAISYTTVITNATCGGSDGAVTISGTGGTGALQYSINNGSTFQNNGSFTGLSVGSYNVVIKDVNNCQTSGVISIGSSNGPTITNSNSSNLTCNGGNDGNIIVTATGSGPLTYSVDGGLTYTSSGTFNGLSAGSYQVTVKDVNGCVTNGSSITLTEPSAINFSTTVVDASCGTNNGQISITAAGGTGSLLYSINGGSTYQSSGNFNGLSSGNYTVVVQDVNLCTQSSTVSISSSNGPTISSSTKTDVTCNGADNGTIQINATGTGTLLYSVDGGVTFTTLASFTNLAAGSYSIVVKDANGCLTNGTNINIAEPAVISYTLSTIDATCGVNDGQISISANGGTGTLSYSINGGTSFQASSVFGSLGSGSYSIVIKDVNNCQVTGSVSINSVPGPIIQTVVSNDITCFGNTDGFISVASNGANPLAFSINGGLTYQSSNIFNGLSSGTYIVNIQDANGCVTNTSSVTIHEPSAIAISSVANNSTCGNSDGSIDLSAVGGTGSYQYSIDGGNIFQGLGSFSGLGAGNYSVVVKDINNCSSNTNVVVTDDNGPSINSVVIIDESCFGANDGSLTVTASGTSPLTYTFNNGTPQSSNIITSITGSVDIMVEDGNGCITAANETIQTASQLVLSSTALDASCGRDNGIATVNVTGGSGNYTYTWDNSSSTNNVIFQLSEGTYQAIVTDDHGCQDSVTITIGTSTPMVVNVDVTHETCPGENDGVISTTVTGGASPYTYAWSNGESTSIVTNLTAGQYTVSVSDANDCVVSLIIPIETENGNCIEIPTAISPNSDGANDVWIISGLEDYPEAKVEIFNRWGSLLFSSNDYQNDWDGTFNGENVSAGVYYYVITIDEDTTYTGSITVIR
ncbi:MAG: gliding motility-associated C-terminal domain-containing protein [Flavobacteriales bacterium]|nr:gliding motility-associated C-terminal domain-containing protein [Flavobacteriales bacterium]